MSKLTKVREKIKKREISFLIAKNSKLKLFQLRDLFEKALMWSKRDTEKGLER